MDQAKKPEEYLIYEEDGKELDAITFDVTPVGTERRKIITVRNAYKHRVTLINPYTSDKDLMIGNYPHELYPSTSGEVELLFRPDSIRTKPLEAMIGFDVVVMGN